MACDFTSAATAALSAASFGSTGAGFAAGAAVVAVRLRTQRRTRQRCHGDGDENGEQWSLHAMSPVVQSGRRLSWPGAIAIFVQEDGGPGTGCVSYRPGACGLP